MVPVFVNNGHKGWRRRGSEGFETRSRPGRRSAIFPVRVASCVVVCVCVGCHRAAAGRAADVVAHPGNAIGADGARAVAAALEKNSTLSSLNLECALARARVGLCVCVVVVCVSVWRCDG